VLKMAVFAPIPRDNTATAARLKPGLLISMRTPWRRLRSRVPFLQHLREKVLRMFPESQNTIRLNRNGKHARALRRTGAFPSVRLPSNTARASLDDIRLAVVDAFLLDAPWRSGDRRRVAGGNTSRPPGDPDYVPLPTEHVSGPSFELSSYDHMKLAEVLATARGNPRGGQPVGGITPTLAVGFRLRQPTWRFISDTSLSRAMWRW
jgi:hypothetical protein